MRVPPVEAKGTLVDVKEERAKLVVVADVPVAEVKRKFGKIELEVEVAIKICPKTFCSTPFTFVGFIHP